MPGPVHASGTAGGPLESGGGDKTKPFVQNAVTVQDEDVGAGAAPSRPAAAVPAGGAPRGDGGLVRNIYPPPPPRKCSNGVREIARCPYVRASIDFLGCRRPHVQSCSSGGGSCFKKFGCVLKRVGERLVVLLCESRVPLSLFCLRALVSGWVSRSPAVHGFVSWSCWQQRQQQQQQQSNGWSMEILALFALSPLTPYLDRLIDPVPSCAVRPPPRRAGGSTWSWCSSPCSTA